MDSVRLTSLVGTIDLTPPWRPLHLLRRPDAVGRRRRDAVLPEEPVHHAEGQGRLRVSVVSITPVRMLPRGVGLVIRRPCRPAPRPRSPLLARGDAVEPPGRHHLLRERHRPVDLYLMPVDDALLRLAAVWLAVLGSAERTGRELMVIGFALPRQGRTGP